MWNGRGHDVCGDRSWWVNKHRDNTRGINMAGHGVCVQHEWVTGHVVAVGDGPAVWIGIVGRRINTVGDINVVRWYMHVWCRCGGRRVV